MENYCSMFQKTISVALVCIHFSHSQLACSQQGSNHRKCCLVHTTRGGCLVSGTVGVEADCLNLPVTLIKHELEGREPPNVSDMADQIQTITGLKLCSAHTEPKHVTEVVTNDSKLLILWEPRDYGSTKRHNSPFNVFESRGIKASDTTRRGKSYTFSNVVIQATTEPAHDDQAASSARPRSTI
jgi:hypothetical protein